MTKNNITDEALLARRLAGEMPSIDIAGESYRAKWFEKELLLEHGSGSSIGLGNLALDANGQNYLCFYHLPTKQPVTIPEDITVLPEDTVLLIIPTEFYIDPVGVSRQYGEDDRSLLSLYPIRDGLKATVVSIEASGLPELIQANKEKKKALQRRIFSPFRKLIARKKNKGKLRNG
jgi:hypothetical protein